MMERKKKRKFTPNGDCVSDHITADTSKPSAVFQPTGGRSYTLSVALPGSIITNAKSHDQRTYLAGTIARALAVFCVDEIVIFEDTPPRTSGSTHSTEERHGDQSSYTALDDPCHFLGHVLSYLETPPYMRKALFPMHPNLRTAGTLPSLDMPHHRPASEWSSATSYCEGVTTDVNSTGRRRGTWVDAGLAQQRFIPDLQISPRTRVTLKLAADSPDAEAVPPNQPREDVGLYWGYSVRRCTSLSNVFTECPFDGGYDLSFGMSERGRPLAEILGRDETGKADDMPRASHMLVVFGGLAGLEAAAASDPALRENGLGAKNVAKLFDYWVNVLPGQGSRTIRTEEAVWLGLMGLTGVVGRIGL